MNPSLLSGNKKREDQDLCAHCKKVFVILIDTKILALKPPKLCPLHITL